MEMSILVDLGPVDNFVQDGVANFAATFERGA
jgi:hypothetical protein